ncbi:hypothetical protein DM01DRAFT_1121581 [Hesseltinella vesiculosa]|uniref:Pentacotripeptide-repeat region of PRORP domain-containing protein n=1 Tax=Hesseltinella vesiculosa TaxID=101127 RepID=A0A1X2GV19_9FUNG|nr:hypothetical protein DM01DRAFT_1121581 [Hesseltinella vesiculosa]
MRRLFPAVARSCCPTRLAGHRSMATSGVKHHNASSSSCWLDVLPTSNQPTASSNWAALPDSDRSTTPHTTSLLSLFYNGLASKNIETIWSLYHALYQHKRLADLSRQNFRQVLLILSQAPKSQANLHRLLTIVSDMEYYQVPLRRSEYHSIMRWVGGATVPKPRPKHLSEALQWLAQMERPSHPHQPAIQPKLVTYNILIHTASQTNDILTAQRLYHSMLAKGIKADVYTYTTLLHCMATTGDVHGVQLMVDRLEREGQSHLLCNTVTWNVLLSSYYSCQQDRANDMFKDMTRALVQPAITNDQNSPSPPKADAITFQLHIHHLLDHQRYDDAIRVLVDTMIPHCPPPLVMYHTFFTALGQASPPLSSPQHLAHVQRLVGCLKSQHLAITSVTLDTLIPPLLDHGDTLYALETFVDLCQQHHITPSQDLLDRLHSVVRDMPPT